MAEGSPAMEMEMKQVHLDTNATCPTPFMTTRGFAYLLVCSKMCISSHEFYVWVQHMHNQLFTILNRDLTTNRLSFDCDIDVCVLHMWAHS